MRNSPTGWTTFSRITKCPRKLRLTASIYMRSPTRTISTAYSWLPQGSLTPDDKEGEWACEEVWSSGENIFTVDTSDEDDTGWSHAQELFREMAEEYLRNGKYADVIKGAKGIAMGFVDGDLEIIG